MDRHSALRLESVIDVSHYDRWFTLKGQSQKNLKLVQCSYESNFTCADPEPSHGMPIIVKRDTWNKASIVGFTRPGNDDDDEDVNDPIFIDRKVKQWISRILTKSIEIKHLPSCRGSDKEALRLILNDQPVATVTQSTAAAAAASTSANSNTHFDVSTNHNVIGEAMQRDNDNRNSLIRKLSDDLERAKRNIENQTRTIDRLLQSLDLKEKKIVDLKSEAERKCESNCLLKSIFYF